MIGDDWKHELAGAIQEHKEAIKTRAINKGKHEAALADFFVGAVNPLVASLANEVRRNGYSAEPDTTTTSAKISVKDPRGESIFSASFKGEASADNLKVVVTNGHKEAETIFEGTDTSEFDTKLIVDYLIRQLRGAKDRPAKKTIQVY